MTPKERLLQWKSLKQVSSVTEQILMSGSNMLASIMVIKTAGIAQFGVYSFILVISLLVSSLFGTLLHKQMMLELSAEDSDTQKNIFLATMGVELIGIFILVSAFATLWAGLSSIFSIAHYLPAAIAGLAYLVMFILFDAFKLYSYTIGKQLYSLRSTVIYVSCQLFLLCLIYIYAESYILEFTLIALTASFTLSILSNKLCIGSLLSAKWLNWKYSFDILSKYFRQGRFSLLSVSITWIQNQSMNPFLMLIGGPQIAGYFSLGRVLIMPIAVVSQGLVNSSTPTLRKAYVQSIPIKTLLAKIQALLKKTLAFETLYVLLLAAGHFSGAFQIYIPDYSEVQRYLLLWIVLITLNTFRFWFGQYFVVSMQFKFLLSTSIISASVTSAGMIFVGLLLDSLWLALFFVILGELISIVIYYRKQQRILFDTPHD